MKKIFSNPYFRGFLLVASGLFLGWLFFHTPGKQETAHDHPAEEAKNEVWTCSMHPQIRMDAPGKCPICAMDLIPLHSMSSSGSDEMAVHFTKEAAQLANVQITVVSGQHPEKEIRLYGKAEADERLLQNQVAHIPGRIEQLLVNFTGEPVRKGQKLAVIYSPELVTAQQELIEAVKTVQSQPEIVEAAKERLRQWKLSEEQIAAIEQSGKIQSNMQIEATTSGIVTARRVNTGDYISPGSVLFQVSDLSRVWILFDAYESDLPFLNIGDRIDFSVQALPGTPFSGTIRFIDPVIDPVNRVAKVRIEMNNPGGKLKPGMFVTGMVRANLEQFRGKLVIPSSAVLWTGKRSIVYVKQEGDEPAFKLREVELGPKLGDAFVVLGGLSEGEEIVSQGAFSVDAAAQLEGKPSMMNLTGGDVQSGHDHDGMSGERNEQKMENDSETPHMEHQMIRVAGNCEMCKERIEAAAKSVAGVVSAEWAAETKMLKVSFSGHKTNVETIQKSIAKAGHDTEKFRAPDEVYKSLPECCLYDRFKY